MKAVTADTFLAELAGQREGRCDRGLRVVERGIEARDLRQRRVELCEGGDCRKVVRLMERREWDEACQLPDHKAIDSHRPLIEGASVDDAVARSDQLVLRELALEPTQERRECVLVSSTFREMVVDQRRAGAVLREKMNSLPDPIALAFAKKVTPGRPDIAGEERELDARRAGIEDEDSVAHASTLALWRASSSAMAHEPSRASVLSARLVRMTGTRAPSTMPATCASARYSSCFASMLPGLEIGHDEDVGPAGDRRHNPFRLGRLLGDSVVEGERPVEDAAGNLAAVGHLAQRGGIEGGLDLFRHCLDRGKDRHTWLREPERVRQLDRVLDDVALLVEGRVDVDSGVGDQQRPRIQRRVDDEHVAHPSRRPSFGSATIAPINSSVWRLPFISASTLWSRASATAWAAAAWLCSVGTSS